MIRDALAHSLVERYLSTQGFVLHDKPVPRWCRCDVAKVIYAGTDHDRKALMIGRIDQWVRAVGDWCVGATFSVEVAHSRS